MEIQLLKPVFALVLLTFIVWVRMFYIRFSEIQKAGMTIKDLRPDNVRNLPSKVIFSGDNFRNLGELPILFYALIAFILYFDEADSLFVGLSWIFVVSRYLHSFIHTTYNKGMHRFLVYIVGAITLWLMWLRFAWLMFN